MQVYPSMRVLTVTYLSLLLLTLLSSIPLLEVVAKPAISRLEDVNSIGGDSKPQVPPIEPIPIPPPGYYIPKLSEDDVNRIIEMLRRYDYIAKALDDGIADVKIKPEISKVGERIAKAFITLEKPLIVNRAIVVKGEVYNIRFIIWNSIVATVDLNRDAIIGSLDLPKPLMVKSLEIILGDDELRDLIRGGEWFIFIFSYGSDSGDRSGLIIMFKEPLWVNTTVRGERVLGWVSSVGVSVDFERGAIKSLDVSLGAPKYKVKLDGMLKQAEDIARLYAKTLTGRDLEMLFVGLKGDYAIFTAHLDEERDVVVTVDMKKLSVDVTKSGIALKAPQWVVCRG